MEFREVCALFGGQRQVSRILGVSDRTVRRWVKEDRCECWVVDRLLKYNKEVESELVSYIC